ncbi:uncharacterized protein LOC132699416 isoform X2 [Cylas formicarius]|uniref:uncharacterized protein LOC132699416 isoform X2 n=1 Tax=Cylas formicarius TaxID=197179 RepID=UPI002958448C|nr:uncharacterized protein LOC132699416 isoform X2 [Cylas formicarius]
MCEAMETRTQPKKRTSNFREDETKLLIQLWGSPQVQNKLYLTHRKAPVMRLIAANMQKHGFHRTPDEIKTRIRNLKCLYHRIKKSTTTGTGIGTVDPDWPHYKAMDEILSKKNVRRHELLYKEQLFGDGEVTIKQEIDDVEFNDELESYTSNSNASDDEFDECQREPLTPTPLVVLEEGDQEKMKPVKIAPKPIAAPPPAVAFPNIQLQSAQGGGGGAAVAQKSGNAAPTIPFPLLILNGVPHGTGPNQNGSAGGPAKAVPISAGSPFNNETARVLRDLLEVQKENLELERERLEVEKQKLEFERVVGSQLLTLIPMFGAILQRMPFAPDKADEQPKKNGLKHSDALEVFKDSKILKELLENGLRKYLDEERATKVVQDAGTNA